jgi:2-phosphoglycerate kinase
MSPTLVVLIGGGTGVGKSTVASELAGELGITRVSSTDFIREILRSVVPETMAPELARSSFELDQGAAPTAHSEFERQAQQVLVGVRAEIERAVREGTSLILEGIHLLPGLVDLGAASESVAVHVILSLGDRDDLVGRLEARADESERPAERYEDGLEAICELQAHLVSTARRTGVPVIENRQVDATVRVMRHLITEAVQSGRPEAGLERAAG